VAFRLETWRIGLVLDRAASLRRDRDRLVAMLDSPDTLLLPVWRSKHLVTSSGEPVLLSAVEGSALCDWGGELVFLGLSGDRACFAVDVSPVEQPLGCAPLSGRGTFADLRAVGPLLGAYDAGLLGYARAMLHFHRHHRHCGLCGRVTTAREGGHVRECSACNTRLFPRTDPAVMILVEHDGRCLLARQPGFPPGMYSVLAGFVEPGETLEQAAVRETAEEVGLGVTDLRYAASQPWPFPASLMLGFFARADHDRFVLDREELEDGRWVTRAELQNPTGFFVPPPFSLAHRLIAEFVAGAR
jgi:NAD+ diphosphatase